MWTPYPLFLASLPYNGKRQTRIDSRGSMGQHIPVPIPVPVRPSALRILGNLAESTVARVPVGLVCGGMGFGSGLV